MHLHNVSDYAPPGYRLERSDMGAGGCKHRFVAEGKPELVCEGSWPDAEAERAALDLFRGLHTPVLVPVKTPDGKAVQFMPEKFARLAEADRELSENLVSEAAVRANDLEVEYEHAATVERPDFAVTKPKPAPKKR